MPFTKEQITFMKKIGVPVRDYRQLTDDDFIAIEDYVGDYLTLQCLDRNYNPNEEGVMCYSILNALP